MNIVNRIETVLINRIDTNNGKYRYRIGRRRIGSLEYCRTTPNIYYLMVPSFGNVGDEAIVEASMLYLTDFFPEYKIVEVDYLDTLQMLKELRRICKQEDLIFLQGGGNIGTLYYDAERMREFIVEKFPDMRIISMPQSMFFSKDKDGNKKLNRSKKVYNFHKALTLIAREKYSFESMQQEYCGCKTLLNPDIVFYLSKIIDKGSSDIRTSVMTCLRTDKEDVLGSSRYGLIRELSNQYEDYIISDTCVPRNVPSEIRSFEVFSLINQFCHAKVVVTDRLHGMVLSAITNTPCVVLPSIDKKVIGTYEWIRDNEGVRFVENGGVEEIVEMVHDLMERKHVTYDWTAFRKHHFDDLRDRIGV